MNIENFRVVLGHIKANPNSWDQTTWHCGTTHCFAGWAQILAGKAAHDGNTRRDARLFLGLNRADADYLFASERTLGDFEAMTISNSAGSVYNCDGYDHSGYDRSGYDRHGYNFVGRDRKKLDREGYDSGGYNCYGYSRDGYDRDGYDRDGLDANNKPKELT